ncbi:hypothetical protein C8F04DRAFT_1094175, partial [Mycena alexandri]
AVKHNISGLKNQSRQQSVPEASDNSSDGDYSDSEGLDLTELDSLAYLELDSDHSDHDEEADWDEVAQTEFHERLLGLITQIEEDRRDAGDTDWVPTRDAYEAKRAAERRKPGGRPTEYMKGPDTASKSHRTQQRYAKSNKGQTKLDTFFSAPSSSRAQSEDLQHSDNGDPPSTETSNSTPFSTAPPSRGPSPPPQIIPRTR